MPQKPSYAEFEHKIRELEAEVAHYRISAANLQEIEDRYRTLFEQNQNPIAVIDTKGRYLDANPAFEPFFTTQEVGAGTGLGLATVYGIVKQNNGFINVYSEPGQGTTFKIYFRKTEEGAPQQAQEAAIETVVRGSETVLVVEDEASILRWIRSVLERFGYSVHTAGTPSEALSFGADTEKGHCPAKSSRFCPQPGCDG